MLLQPLINARRMRGTPRARIRDRTFVPGLFGNMFAKKRLNVTHLACSRKCRARTKKQIPLRTADAAARSLAHAPRTIDKIEHRRIFDSFGDNVRPGHAREGHDRRHDAARVAIRHPLENNLAIDLHEVEVHATQDFEPRMPGARIVERQAKSGVPQCASALDHRVDVRDRAFGYFNHNALWGQAGGDHGGSQRSDIQIPIERLGRNVQEQ